MTKPANTSVEHLAGRILELARREDLQPDDRLFEARLATQIGVSRGPIRSALKYLAEEGIAEAVHNRGFVLRQPVASARVRSLLAASNVSDETYTRLAEDRMQGRLPDVVTEAEVMRLYDLTRPDAVRLLNRIASEGWVERLAGYGWRFSETLSSPQAYNHTTRLRIILETSAILEPGYNLAPDTIDYLRKLQHRFREGAFGVFTLNEIFQFGCEFHESIAAGAGNPFLTDTLRRLNLVRRLFVYRLVMNEALFQRQAEEHLQLLDMLETGNLRQASRFLATHMEGTLWETEAELDLVCT